MSTSLDLIKKIIREGKGDTFTKGLLGAMTELNHIKPQSLGGLLSRCIREDKHIQRCKQRMSGHPRDEYVYWYDEKKTNAEYRRKPRKRKPRESKQEGVLEELTTWKPSLNLVLSWHETLIELTLEEAKELHKILDDLLFPSPGPKKS